MDLSRRATLETGAGALAAAALAGCLGGDEPSDEEPSGSEPGSSSEGDGPTVEEPDEYPDGVDESDGSETGTTDENGYETYAVDGRDVPMVPTADVHDWYAGDEDLVVVDARSTDAYERVHIEGAVSSPAPGGREADDPLEDVAADARIVTYCTCPRTLSGHRAAALLDEGYTEVYLLKEGLQDWVEKGHPIAGTEVD